MAVAVAVNVVAAADVAGCVGAVVALVAAAAGRAHRDHRVVLAVVVWPPHSAVPPPVPAPPQRRGWPSSPPFPAAAPWLWLPCLDRLLLPWADAAVCLASRRSAAAVGETRQRRGRKRKVFNKLQASFGAGRAKDQRPMPATNGSSS